jgi:3-oxoacyl-[acyl-carrier-protein] synthase III
LDLERLMGAAITACGAALPKDSLDNAELAKRLDVDEDWIYVRTGIRSRRIAAENDTTGSLATQAAAQVLDRTGVAAEDLDLVIVATFTPDYQLPATAPLVAASLGATNAGAFDLSAACSGFLYALAQASALIENGTMRRVLVCGADVLSRITDYSDARSCVLFGDGAGAALVEETEGPTRLGPFRLKADGTRPELLWIPPEKGTMQMEGREVYKHAVAGMSSTVKEVLEESGLTIEDVDLVVAHQANARILKAVAERLAVPDEKVMTNIARVGNTSAASIPLAIAEAYESGRISEGDRIVVTAFGGGFTWGAGLLRWGVGSRREQELAVAGKTHG